MKRKEYEKPTMQIVQLKQQCQILSGSGESPRTAGRDNYGVIDVAEE